ncbi:MAG: right-handed parallel beta-helix repeat-containing protein [Candidatus Eremiobacteraeota bacterium]|nr:right-handed parallel beta-helix repeat-containing protein [Candidatus Eremiobacteraeota bacterium]
MRRYLALVCLSLWLGCTPTPPPPADQAQATPVATATPPRLIQNSPVQPAPEGYLVVKPGPDWWRKLEGADLSKGVYLEPGTYELEKAMVLVGDARIQGAGILHTRIVSTSSRLALGFAQGGKVELAYLTIEHQGDKPANVLDVEAKSLKMMACGLRNATAPKDTLEAGNGLLLRGQTSAEIELCEFSGNRACGVYQTGQTKAQARHCQVFGNQLSGWLGDEAAELDIQDSEIYENAYNGLDWAGGKLMAAKNHCRENQKTGILTTTEATATLHENVCNKNGHDGIQVDGHYELVGNECSENASLGINVDGEQAGVIKANKCEKNALHGIEVGVEAAPTVTDNQLTKNGGAGLSYYQQAAGTASGNTIAGNGRAAIVVEAPASPKLGENSISGEVIQTKP